NTTHTVIYTLSLHDALPIYKGGLVEDHTFGMSVKTPQAITIKLADLLVIDRKNNGSNKKSDAVVLLDESAVNAEVEGFISSLLRSEEHTSELQSRENLVCRL